MSAWRLLVVVALLAATSASADVVRDDGIIDRYALRPEHPDANTPIRIELHMSGCLPVAPHPTVLSVNGSHIRFGVRVDDFCDPSLEERTQSYPIGTLAAGDYDVTYLICAGAPPPGTEPCGEIASESLHVSGAEPNEVHRVPTLSTLGWIVMACAIAMGAQFASRSGNPE